jgi:hypothetical protein
VQIANDANFHKITGSTAPKNEIYFIHLNVIVFQFTAHGKN